mmetsp:Transcript_111499/g.310482  ORF Transcript_111499/g.310482 Transcript_111499/m.310482 type:complete len:104 (+) Transcript_111499:269-580(+)
MNKPKGTEQLMFTCWQHHRLFSGDQALSAPGMPASQSYACEEASLVEAAIGAVLAVPMAVSVVVAVADEAGPVEVEAAAVLTAATALPAGAVVAERAALVEGS